MDEEPEGNETTPDVQESLMGALIGARGVPGGLQGLPTETEDVSSQVEDAEGSETVDPSGELSAETAQLLGISQSSLEKAEAHAEVEPEPEPEAEPELLAEVEPEPEPEAQAEAEPEPEPAAVPEAEPESAAVDTPEAAVAVEVEAPPEVVSGVEAEDNIDDPDPAGLGRVVLEWAVVLVGAVVMALVLRQFIFQAFWIPSESMETTLEIRDRVLVNRLSYQWGDVGRGDIVVFARKPEEVGEIRDLIKRVIALPGETVEGRDNLIYIDGVLLDEPYVDESNRVFADFGPVTVPPDELFVMGDNRDQSFDSRLFGTVDVDRIAGRAFVTFWPLDRVGSL